MGAHPWALAQSVDAAGQAGSGLELSKKAQARATWISSTLALGQVNGGAAGTGVLEAGDAVVDGCGRAWRRGRRERLPATWGLGATPERRQATDEETREPGPTG